MRVLLDTCVISELSRAKGEPRVRDRVAAFGDEDLFVSVITVGEIACGVSLLDAGERRERFEAYLLQLERGYADRILGIDTETARIWGEITATARRRGHTVGASDGLIAATALRHGLHVMTRNVRDFEPTGVLLTNPWDGAATR